MDADEIAEFSVVAGVIIALIALLTIFIALVPPGAIWDRSSIKWHIIYDIGTEDSIYQTLKSSKPYGNELNVTNSKLNSPVYIEVRKRNLCMDENGYVSIEMQLDGHEPVIMKAPVKIGNRRIVELHDKSWIGKLHEGKTLDVKISDECRKRVMKFNIEGDIDPVLLRWAETQ